MRLKHVRDEIDRIGYLLLANMSPVEFREFVFSFGQVQVDVRSPEQIRDIRPQIASDAKANTLSSRYGLSEFPFHTDVAHWECPARYLFLHCENPGSGSRMTFIQDSGAWDLSPQEKRSVLCDVWKCGHAYPHLCTVGTLKGETVAIRFDEACMVPLTNSAIATRDRIRARIRGAAATPIGWTAGDTLVLDNHRILHARGRASRSDLDRVIKRALVGDFR